MPAVGRPWPSDDDDDDDDDDEDDDDDDDWLTFNGTCALGSRTSPAKQNILTV